MYAMVLIIYYKTQWVLIIPQLLLLGKIIIELILKIWLNFMSWVKKNGNFRGRSGHYYDKNKEQTQKHYRYHEKGGKEKLSSIMKVAKGGYRR